MKFSVPAKENFLLAASAMVLLGLLNIWLWGNNYVSDDALQLWSRMLGVFDNDSVHIEFLGYLYPHGLFYTLVPLHYLGPLDTLGSAYLVTAMFGVLLLLLWNKDLRDAGHHGGFRLTVILLLAVHPSFLWHATNGALGSISLLLFYFLYVSVLKVTREQDIHSFILVGIVLAVFYFASALTIYLFIALVPLLALMVPRQILIRAPLSAYVILAVPLLVVVGAWLYFNWVFYGSPLAFMHDPSSGFMGGRQYIEEIRWLRDYGGKLLSPAVVGLLLVFAAYPIIFRLLGQIRKGEAHFRAALVLFLHPVMAGALATFDYYLVHPMQVISLVIAGVMAEMTVYQSGTRYSRRLAVGFLALGLAGGWGAYLYSPTPQMQRWESALLAPVPPEDIRADMALGTWLAGQPHQTLISETSGYKAIVARGHARDLVLSFTDQFKIQLRRGTPTIKQIAVPSPESEMGRRDPINQRWPKIYERGPEGYHLVYDYQGWRVWRSDV